MTILNDQKKKILVNCYYIYHRRIPIGASSPHFMGDSSLPPPQKKMWGYPPPLSIISHFTTIVTDLQQQNINKHFLFQ